MPDEATDTQTLSPEREHLIETMIRRMPLDNLNKVPGVDIAISEAEAQAFAMKWIGRDRFWGNPALNTCWLRLSRASSPQQCLSYERLITALATMQGMERYEEGARLCADNRAQVRAAAQEDAEARALQRWASFIAAPAVTPDQSP